MNINFPEDIVPIIKDRIGLYNYNINKGRSLCKDKTILFCGICRDVEKTIELNIERLQKLGSFFKACKVFIYENDSSDNTVNIINRCKLKYNNISFVSEHRDDHGYRELILNGQDKWHYHRCCILADCRNQYIKYMQNHAYDYACVVDLDIIGGWSYNGFLHAISILEQDMSVGCVSAYGILSEPSNSLSLEQLDPQDYLMYDSFAYRPTHIQRGVHMTKLTLFNQLVFIRAEDPISVMSNFGGMAIYKYSLLQNKHYVAKQWQEGYVDPDHVSVNLALNQEGYKVLLDPSLVCSYSRHEFCKDI